MSAIEEQRHGRAAFRIVYPLGARPQLLLQGVSVPVIDASERGLRLRLPTGFCLVADSTGSIAGELHLAHGEAVPVAGALVRTEQNIAVIALDDGSRIPLWLFYDEQRYLRSQFPDWH